MWAVAAILLMIAVIFGMYLTLEAERHDREELKKVREEIEDAKAKLEEALVHHKDDFDLHSACRQRLLRLRKREDELR